MAKTGKPRSGSMQYWPRKKAKKPLARVRSWISGKDTKALGFAGYKIGMTHIEIIDNHPNSMAKGKELIFPVTVIECPPLKVFGLRLYKTTDNKKLAVDDVLSENLDKEVLKKITSPKKTVKKIDDSKVFDNISLLVHTQPKLTRIGKKKPEIFEIALSGNKDDQLNYAKERLGKELKVTDVLKEGQQVDAHAITKGKGNQGPVKRFGVGLTSHKSEKTRRGPGSLGPWCGQGKIMWRVAYSGQVGYHQRTEYNKWVVSISEDIKAVNPKGGFLRYGDIKNTYILVKGSIPGASKRLIKFTDPIRPNKNIIAEAPKIEFICTESKQ